MSRGTITLGGTAGERVTIALVILTLCVEVLSDNWSTDPHAEPMTFEQCYQTCYPRPIHRLEAFACECQEDTDEQ